MQVSKNLSQPSQAAEVVAGGEHGVDGADFRISAQSAIKLRAGPIQRVWAVDLLKA